MPDDLTTVLKPAVKPDHADERDLEARQKKKGGSSRVVSVRLRPCNERFDEVRHIDRMHAPLVVHPALLT